MKLTEKQTLAANHKDGPCLVLAVPGSGKTTMILERIKILSKDIDPKKILSLTFSKTQAIDMKERYEGPASNFMTIHAFCYLIIRNYYKKQKRSLKILENDDSYNKYNLIKQIYYDINGSIISNEDLKNFFADIGYMRNSMADISSLRKSQIKNIDKIYYEYEKFKKENSYIDFDDMQTMAYDLINTDQRLLASIKNKYKYIQLDEGQDTSLLQFKILERIVYPENNLMIVADDDQSIYSFRAAEPGYLLAFKNRFDKSQIITMNQNHRSQANIVKASNGFINSNIKRFDKELFTNKAPTSKIKMRVMKNSYDTYKYILNNINPNKSNAILYRNNISSLNLVSFLMEDNLDFSINAGSNDFFESKIISDLIDIINFSNDLDNIELFESIYYKVKTYLSKEEINQLSLKPINYSIFDYLYEIIDDSKAYTLSQKEKEFNHLKNLTIDRKISFIYQHMGYRDYIKMFSNKYYEVILNKDLYIESLTNFTKGLQTLDQFEEKIEIYNKIINRPTSSNIILSTIHKSKGLEYDNVFVIDLVKNEFPMFFDDADKEVRLEEERRIFYVAMTRAKENLHLITLKKRNNISVEPSLFYKEVKNFV